MDRSGSAEAAPIAPGDIIAGKYEVERVIGMGAMGVVVAARHLDLEQRVAIKVLRAWAVSNIEVTARFMREARAAAKIHGEHAARVLDVGKLENGTPYIVMECLEGEDLACVLERRPLAIEDAVDYIVQACDAMAEAHEQGIIHRDLKPSNLFLTRPARGSRVVKVLDFGISKIETSNAFDGKITGTTSVIGSPTYMSPEQMKSSREVDARTDVWSLGVILFELLAGAPPFAGETLTELVSAIVLEMPSRLRSLRPEVPEGLEAVIMKCLAKERDKRFASVTELASALAPYAPRRSRPTLARMLKLGENAAFSTSSLTAQAGVSRSLEPPPHRADSSDALPLRPRRGLTALLLLLIAAACVGVYVAAARPDPSPSMGENAPAVAADSTPAMPVASAVSPLEPSIAPAIAAPSVVPVDSVSIRSGGKPPARPGARKSAPSKPTAAASAGTPRTPTPDAPPRRRSLEIDLK